MNSFPTELSPWYVVSQFRTLSHLGQQYYYTSQIDAADLDEVWTEDQKKAQLFLNLSSAIRVAKSLKAEVIVVWNKEQLADYGRDVGR